MNTDFVVIYCSGKQQLVTDLHNACKLLHRIGAKDGTSSIRPSYLERVQSPPDEKPLNKVSNW
jgi:hypothetical protein